MNKTCRLRADWLTYSHRRFQPWLTIPTPQQTRLNKCGLQDVQVHIKATSRPCVMNSVNMELPAFGEHVFQADYIQKKRHRRVSTILYLLCVQCFKPPPLRISAITIYPTDRRPWEIKGHVLLLYCQCFEKCKTNEMHGGCPRKSWDMLLSRRATAVATCLARLPVGSVRFRYELWGLTSW